MKQIIFALLVLVTLTSTQFYTPTHSTVQTTPIQLSEVVIYGSASVKMQPIIFPAVVITGNADPYNFSDEYCIHLPEITVVGESDFDDYNTYCSSRGSYRGTTE
jgi:hypothetical protein